MFIVYYAVLSEVSPPTALSSVAAAAITGGDAFKTMMLTLRYTLPAFLVPFAFVLSPNGEGLLLQGPILGIVWTWPRPRWRWPPWPWPPAAGCWARPGCPSGSGRAGRAAAALPGAPEHGRGAGLLVAAVAVHLAMRRSGGAPSATGPRQEAAT